MVIGPGLPYYLLAALCGLSGRYEVLDNTCQNAHKLVALLVTENQSSPQVAIFLSYSLYYKQARWCTNELSIHQSPEIKTKEIPSQVNLLNLLDIKSFFQSSLMPLPFLIGRLLA